MKEASFATSLTLEQNPAEVFKAIIDLSSWWSGEFIGDSKGLGAEFTYRYGDVHFSKQKVTDWQLGKRLVWDVFQAHLSFVENTQEWEGTRIVFDLLALPNGGTELRFTHFGLVPSFACYDACSNAWDGLVHQNLRQFIATGKPQPDLFA